jgi:hypothetical protein
LDTTFEEEALEKGQSRQKEAAKSSAVAMSSDDRGRIKKWR